MAVAAPDLSTFKLAEPACADCLELSSGAFDFVNIDDQLIVGQRAVINDQQSVESRTEFAHRTSEMGTNMRATLHLTTDTQANEMRRV